MCVNKSLIHSIWHRLSCYSLRSFSMKTRKAPVMVHLYRRTDIFMKWAASFIYCAVCNYPSLTAEGRSSQWGNFRERSRVKMCAWCKMDHSMTLSGKRKSKNESWVKSDSSVSHLIRLKYNYCVYVDDLQRTQTNDSIFLTCQCAVHFPLASDSS